MYRQAIDILTFLYISDPTLIDKRRKKEMTILLDRFAGCSVPPQWWHCVERKLAKCYSAQPGVPYLARALQQLQLGVRTSSHRFFSPASPLPLITLALVITSYKSPKDSEPEVTHTVIAHCRRFYAYITPTFNSSKEAIGMPVIA